MYNKKLGYIFLQNFGLDVYSTTVNQLRATAADFCQCTSTPSAIFRGSCAPPPLFYDTGIRRLGEHTWIIGCIPNMWYNHCHLQFLFNTSTYADEALHLLLFQTKIARSYDTDMNWVTVAITFHVLLPYILLQGHFLPFLRSQWPKPIKFWEGDIATLVRKIYSIELVYGINCWRNLRKQLLKQIFTVNKAYITYDKLK